jgi:Flp pilus assembly pilin Flp
MLRRLGLNIRLLARDSRGVAALEWAILSAAIVITVATSMPGIKTSLTSIYTIITTALG